MIIISIRAIQCVTRLRPRALGVVMCRFNFCQDGHKYKNVGFCAVPANYAANICTPS